MGLSVDLGAGVVLGREVAEGDLAGADIAVAVGGEAGVGALVGAVAVHAANTRAAGITHSALIQPVFALDK